MTQEKTRESNIELLRILSMVYIVLYHFFLHGLKKTSPELEYLIKPIISVLHIGVICFVLISGYWGIKFSLKGFAKLFLQCSFYSVIIYLVYGLITPEHFSFKELANALLPFQWWYIQIYLCLYLLSPIVNLPLQTNDAQKKLVYIGILAVISMLLGHFIPSLSDGKNPVNFILIYYIGNFIRHHLKHPSKKIVGYYILFNLVVFFSLFATSSLPVYRNWLYDTLFFPYNSIGLFINAVLFFLCFETFSFKSKFINWIAISILPVYLLHENQYLSHYLYDFVKRAKETIDLPILFGLFLLVLAMAVILAGVLIDKLLSPVYKALEIAVTKSSFFEKLDSQVHQILAKKDKA